MRPVTRKMYVFKFPNDGQKYTGRTGESVYEVILGISWPTFKKIYTEENLPDEIKLAMGMIDASNADITSENPYGYAMTLFVPKAFSTTARYAVMVSTELYEQITEGKIDEHTRSKSEDEGKDYIE